MGPADVLPGGPAGPGPVLPDRGRTAPGRHGAGGRAVGDRHDLSPARRRPPRHPRGPHAGRVAPPGERLGRPHPQLQPAAAGRGGVRAPDRVRKRGQPAVRPGGHPGPGDGGAGRAGGQPVAPGAPAPRGGGADGPPGRRGQHAVRALGGGPDPRLHAARGADPPARMASDAGERPRPRVHAGPGRGQRARRGAGRGLGERAGRAGRRAPGRRAGDVRGPAPPQGGARGLPARPGPGPPGGRGPDDPRVPGDREPAPRRRARTGPRLQADPFGAPVPRPAGARGVRGARARAPGLAAGRAGRGPHERAAVFGPRRLGVSRGRGPGGAAGAPGDHAVPVHQPGTVRRLAHPHPGGPPLRGGRRRGRAGRRDRERGVRPALLPRRGPDGAEGPHRRRRRGAVADRRGRRGGRAARLDRPHAPGDTFRAVRPGSAPVLLRGRPHPARARGGRAGGPGRAAGPSIPSSRSPG